MAENSLYINDRKLSFQPGETVLAVASRNNIHIPTLCFLGGLSMVGSCRMCLVCVEGQPNPVTACAIEARPDMRIFTDSERLRAQRRQMLEMLFAEGHHICAACIANGHCELQALARHEGLDVLGLPSREPFASIDASHPQFAYDPNRCVLCTRCVRACSEFAGVEVWQVIGRGSNAHAMPNMGQPWGDSESCTSCGYCVEACPTGAIYAQDQSVGHMQKDCQLFVRLKQQQQQKEKEQV